MVFDSVAIFDGVFRLSSVNHADVFICVKLYVLF